MPKQSTLLKLLSPLAESWSLGWPMILIMFFQFSIGFADVFVAGYLGTDILAAMGYVAQLYWTLMILANGISVGTVSMVSQAYGAKSCVGVAGIGGNSLLVGVCIAGVLTGLAQVFPGSIVRIAGMPEEIRAIAENFIRVFSLVLIPTYVMIITSGILRSSGRVRITMINSFVASSINVAGDLALTFGFGPVPALGYPGIAWATAIGTTVGMVLNLVVALRGPNRIMLRSVVDPIVPCIKNLLRLGVPTVLQQAAWNVGTLVVYFLVGTLRDGQITALAAMTAGIRVEAIIFLPIFALNMAAAVLTGNRIGSGDIPGARARAQSTAFLCLVIILIPSVAIFLFAPEISLLLSSDSEVLEEIVRYLRINMLGMPFLAVGITLAGSIQGAGDTYGSMRIIVGSMWLLRIPLILVNTYLLDLGPSGVWWAMTISMIVMCGLFTKRFFGSQWTTASIDKTKKSRMWEACVPAGKGLIEPSRGWKNDG